MYGGSCYGYSDILNPPVVQVLFEKALDVCAAIGSHLIVIENENEYQFSRSLFTSERRQRSEFGFWIGMNRSSLSGKIIFPFGN